jgi:class 3 adenylate cyclase
MCWAVLGLALLLTADTVWTQRARVGKTTPGFGVTRMRLVAVGGLGTDRLKPFDLVRAVDGRPVASGPEILARVQAEPSGTVFRYLVNRRGALIETEIPSRPATAGDFRDYLTDGLLPSLLFLVLAAVVLWIKPGAPDTRLFVGLCLVWSWTAGFYVDAFTTYRMDRLFLTAWAFSPAFFIHMALTVPERRRVLGCHPRSVWIPYGLSGILALLLHVGSASEAWVLAVPMMGAAYWGLSLLFLVVALARASVTGSTGLARQRARVLMVAFALGQLIPVLGTAGEAVLGVAVPGLSELWRLNLLFPLTVAYAMVRYNLFDVRAVVRAGAVYATVTGLVVLAYAGALTLMNLATARTGLSESSSILPAAAVALAVVLFLNPVYVRTQAVVDRMFFRRRLDIQASLVRLSDEMTTLLDLPRIVAAIRRTLVEVFAPVRSGILILDDADGVYRLEHDRPEGAEPIPVGSPLVRRLAEGGLPLTREQIREDPALTVVRDVGLAQMDAFAIELVAPLFFRERMTAMIGLGAKRSGAAYTTQDLRTLRLLCNQSAVALEHAKAYSTLQATNAELHAALRRVEILESIRGSLSKFVPRAVQALIERAPDAPALDKREVDVSVLFVDIAGYTRLSERLDLDAVNHLVERYFGSFLDEILRHGGDVNETAGDGLMVIFQHEEPRRHAEAAVRTALAILRRAEEINADLGPGVEPIRLHVGVNSGVAALGATKIEGKAGTRWVYTASGPVTNLAARLAALSEGEAVVIGPETRSRLAAGWTVEDLGDRHLRHVEQPVRVFRIGGASQVRAGA